MGVSFASTTFQLSTPGPKNWFRFRLDAKSYGVCSKELSGGPVCVAPCPEGIVLGPIIVARSESPVCWLSWLPKIS